MEEPDINAHTHLCPQCQKWHLCYSEYCEMQVEQSCAECIKNESSRTSR